MSTFRGELHYWYAYLNTDTNSTSKPARPLHVLFDLLGLLFFGLLGAFTCYASSLHGIFAGHLAIVVVGLVWCLLRTRFRDIDECEGWDRVIWVWGSANFAQTGAIVLGWLVVAHWDFGLLPLPLWGWFPWPPWNLSLTVLVVVYLGILVADVYCNLIELTQAKSS